MKWKFINYRDMSGMSQIEAAKELSIPPSVLSKYENYNAQISIKMFVQMFKIYEIPKVFLSMHFSILNN